MSEGSKSRLTRVALKGLSGGNKGTYRVSSDINENSNASTINKGQSSGDVSRGSSSIGEKTLTRETASASNYHIEISKLRTILSRLRAYSDSDQDKLSTTLKDDLNAIKQIYMSIDADNGRDQLTCLIDEIFGDINLISVVPNTVAAFFLGCKTSNCNGVPLGCSPQCANALPSDANLTGYAPCDAAVYLLQNGVLSLSTHGTGNSGNAYVYVDAKFTGYSSNVIQRLAQNKVKAIKTVKIDGSKCVQIGTDFVPLVKLAAAKKHSSDDSSMGGMSNNVWMWILVALLVILIIGGIWVLASRNRYSGGSDETAMRAAAYSEKSMPATSASAMTSQSLTPEFFRNMANTFSSPMSI